MKKRILIISLVLMATITNAQSIFDAIQDNDLEKVKTLIESDKTVVKQKGGYGDTPLHIAALVDNDVIAKLLIEYGANLEAQNGSFYSPLLLAGLKVTKVLVEKGADINFISHNGHTTALSRALLWKEKEIAEYLIKYGAKLPEKNSSEYITNLINATKKGIIPYLNLCLNDGLNPFYVGESKSNLFHYAAESNSIDLLDKLFGLGVPINQANIYGWTPIHNAAYYGNQVSVEWFVNKGLDINERTINGQSPYNLAVEAKNIEVVNFLKTISADHSPQQFPELTGDYLGQKTPDIEPIPFAPGIIATTHRFHSTIAFSKDGDEAYWGFPDILFSIKKNGKWIKPDTTLLINKGDAPFFSPDGKRFYFVAQVGEYMWEREAIGYMEKRLSGWSGPILLPQIINATPGIHFGASVDMIGNLYFGARQEGTVTSRIYFSEYLDGAYTKPIIMEHLKDINAFSPYIAPDGQYMIFTSWDLGGLVVSFRKKDGDWTDGQLVTEFNEPPDRCPIVSHDGQFLFYLHFTDDRYIPYWVDAKIIEELKESAKKNGYKQ